MRELRVIHFADLHLGVESGGRPHPVDGLNHRIHDVCDRLDELCDVAEAEGVHAVLFAGDAFKNQHPSPTLQNLFARRIRRLARSGAAVFLLVGNHDLPRSAGLAHPFSIYDALETENVVVGDRARIYPLTLGPRAPAPVLQVAALPHFSRHQVLAQLGPDFDGDVDEMIAAQFRRTLHALRESVDAAAPAVFLGHCHVQQADAGTTRDLFGVSDVEVSIGELLTPSAFPYYALGHLHKRQVLSEEPFAAYSGSLERIDFGEGERIDVATNGAVTRTDPDAKGFFRFDLVADGDGWRLARAPEFRPVRARPFITLRLGDLALDDPAHDLETRIRAARAAGASFEDAFVKITGRTVTADRPRVTRSAVRVLIPEAYDVRVALDAADEQSTARDPRFAVPMSEYESLATYLETRDDWSEDRDEILRLGRELIDEVLS